MTHEIPPPRVPAVPYWRRVLLALDRFGNALAGGDDRQTISQRLRDGGGWVHRHILRHFAHDDHERR